MLENKTQERVRKAVEKVLSIKQSEVISDEVVGSYEETLHRFHKSTLKGAEL